MKRFLMLAPIAIVVGCTSTSGVLPAGNGNYTITTGASPGAGGLSESKRLAYTEANNFCTKQGKKFVTVSESNEPMSFFGDGKANTAIQFRCE